MKEKTKSRTNKVISEKLGRPEELKIDDLPKRFRDMKQFLENYWGRVGLGLMAARCPEDVRATLILVPGIEWMAPFRGYAICLIAPVAIQSDGNQIRVMRRKLEDVEAKVDQIWTEYHDTSQSAQQATVALKSAISQFETAIGYFCFFFVSVLIAKTLRVEELNRQFWNLEKAVRAAQREKELMKDALSAQEAWYARNEVVKFALNRRHGKTLLNFARALAGLPEWGWFHSRRMCAAIQDKSIPASPHQVFELLTKITRKMKPLKLAKVEKRLRSELLRPDADPVLRAYVTPHWDYLEESVRFCKGKEFKRAELPFKIMDRFLYHLEKGKTIVETELAKLNQLR